MTKTAIIFAGGTGGHVYPGIAIAKELIKKGFQCHWVGTSSGLESRVVVQHGLPFTAIRISGLRRSGLLRLFAAPFTILMSIIRSILVIRRLNPDLVIGMGGYVSGPGGVAAYLCRCPLVIHEQNTVPGLTNRLLSFIATRVLQGFPKSFPSDRSAIVTGNPVREDITGAFVKERDRNSSLINRVLVFGGSQGASVLNIVVPAALAKSMVSDLVVHHQVGEIDTSVFERAYATSPNISTALVVPYITDMASAYSAATLVIARSGAMTIAELTACGIPSILIPYPYAADGHQEKNARFLEERGGAICLLEEDCKVDELAQLINRVFLESGLHESMSKGASSASFPRATSEIVKHCLELSDA
jgi:UDP-N-acetylglucosamine--N-acetylmuramyl-(pentapeptide) pyrophosphoryl-undecaprenol N-acetylglucosamine transferase